MDRKAAEKAIENFLKALDIPLEEELLHTPKRVVDAWTTDILSGETKNPEQIMIDGSVVNQNLSKDLIIVRDISVSTTCPHHLLPAHGTASLVYLPGPKIVGFGTLCQMVDALAHRLTLQEELGSKISNAIVRSIEARWVICKLSMTHTCLISRGERKTGSRIETFSFAGLLDENEKNLGILALNSHEPMIR